MEWDLHSVKSCVYSMEPSWHCSSDGEQRGGWLGTEACGAIEHRPDVNDSDRLAGGR